MTAYCLVRDMNIVQSPCMSDTAFIDEHIDFPEAYNGQLLRWILEHIRMMASLIPGELKFAVLLWPGRRRRRRLGGAPPTFLKKNWSIALRACYQLISALKFWSCLYRDELIAIHLNSSKVRSCTLMHWRRWQKATRTERNRLKK